MNANPKTIFHVLLSLLSSLGEVTSRLSARRRLLGSPTHLDASTAVEMSNLSGSHLGCVAEFLIISGLITVQLINAAYMVLLIPVMSLGVNPLFLIIFGSFTTAIFVLPFAIACERKKWPKRLSFTLMVQFLLISLGGVTTFQALMLLGIKKTSPAIASAMPNLAPGIIFIIAVCLRFEKVDIRSTYSRSKILGTLLCLTGAVAMSFLQNPSTLTTMPSQETKHEDWIIGCFYLLAAVVVVSCTTVLQAATMIHFPAPFTLCAIITFLGAILTAMVQIITEGKLDIGSPTVNLASIVAIILLGSMVIALCLGFQTWCVQMKGPVLVSMFSPIQTVCSAILSALFLGKVINVESIMGMFLMFFGLYIVLWAKNKEAYNFPSVDGTTRQPIDDIEKPLLS